MDTPDFTPTELNLTKAATHVVTAHQEHDEAGKDTDPDKGWVTFKTAAALRSLLTMWEDLTGLQGDDALTYAYQVHRNPGQDIRAAVSPF